VGSSGITVYEVGTVKPVDLGGRSRLYVSVDGGMSDNIRTALYGADYTVVLANRQSDAAPALSRVVGKHCESGDVVVRDAWLPADIRPGDLLAVAATGAYCRSMASNYNYLPRPAVVSAAGGRCSVVLRRETLDDMFTTDAGLA
jgi:diaminopimelate decarboxylase